MHKEKKSAVLKVTAFALTAVLCCSTAALIVAAAVNHVPQERVEGNRASTVMPVVAGAGSSAEVLTPQIVTGGGTEAEPYEPFIPNLKDDEPFIDMDVAYDFSTQYDYTNASLVYCNGNYSISGGAYTATAANSIYANRNAETPFPYGTLSADVMNNGSDSGLIFGLSSNVSSFWEGAGVSYYFAFVSFEGILFLGRTVNGGWASLAYTDISGFDANETYHLQVVYRVDKIVLALDGVPMVSYRTDTPLEGTGWGIRTGAVGATISNITISNKVTLD